MHTSELTYCVDNSFGKCGRCGEFVQVVCWFLSRMSCRRRSLCLFKRLWVPHADVPVHLTSLVDHNAQRCDVSLDYRGRLYLHTVIGKDRPVNFPTDNRIAREDIPLNRSPFRDKHLPVSPHGADHRSLDFYDAVGNQFAGDSGPRRNHG